MTGSAPPPLPRRRVGDFAAQTGINQSRLFRIRRGEAFPTSEEITAIAGVVGERSEVVEAMARRTLDPTGLVGQVESVVAMSEALAVEARRLRTMAKRQAARH